MNALNHIKADARELLLNAAEKLFADYGFDRTTIRMIAGVTSLNVALISYYFGSKQDMFIQLFKSRLQHLNNALQHVPQLKLEAPEKLMAFLEIYAGVFSNNHSFHCLLHREITFLPQSIVNEYITAYLDTTLGILKKLIEGGVGDGCFKATDSQLVYLTIFGMLPVMMSGAPLSKLIAKKIEPDGNAFSTGRIKQYLYHLLQTPAALPGRVPGK